MVFNITIEKLELSEVENFFEKTISDFSDFKDASFRHERALKLATYADFVTVRENGEIVGMVGYYMNQKPLCYISHVSVLADYRRKGLFKELYNVLENKVSCSGYNVIKLEVYKTNIPAIRSYMSCGFSIEHDISFDRIYMSKRLK